MELEQLYNMCLENYNKTGFKLHPSKLLSMLLLSEWDKFEPINDALGKFYEKYQKQIDEKINKVEKDFNFTKDQFLNYIEQGAFSGNYEYDKIWFVYGQSIELLHWAIAYGKLKTKEKCYIEWFEGRDWLEGITDDISRNNKNGVTKINKL